MLNIAAVIFNAITPLAMLKYHYSSILRCEKFRIRQRYKKCAKCKLVIYI